MATMLPPQKGVEYITYVCLRSQANVKVFQSNPTLAAGDVTVSTDDNALTNLDTLPVVSPAGSYFVKVTVSAAEMNGDNVNIHFHDVAGDEWCDLGINIPTSGQPLDEVNANVLSRETPAHVTAEVDDLITRVKGLNAIYDSVALRGLETTLTSIKGAGWTNETLKLIKELVDELESGEKPPPRASFRM